MWTVGIPLQIAAVVGAGVGAGVGAMVGAGVGAGVGTFQPSSSLKVWLRATDRGS